MRVCVSHTHILHLRRCMHILQVGLNLSKKKKEREKERERERERERFLRIGGGGLSVSGSIIISGGLHEGRRLHVGIRVRSRVLHSE